MGEVEQWWFRTKAAGLQLIDLCCPDDDQNGDFREGPISLRCARVHMIEEYARHDGHADLLRERIDGATGD